MFYNSTALVPDFSSLAGLKLIKGIMDTLEGVEYFGYAMSYFSKIIASVLLIVLFFYFIKSLYEAARGQANWDDLLEFAIRKGFIVILFFLFSVPSHYYASLLGEDWDRGGADYPFAVELYLKAMRASYNSVGAAFGTDFDDIPFKLAKEVKIWGQSAGELMDSVISDLDYMAKAHQVALEDKGLWKVTQPVITSDGKKIVYSYETVPVLESGSSQEKKDKGILDKFLSTIGSAVGFVKEGFKSALTSIFNYFQAGVISLVYRGMVILGFLSLLLSFYVGAIAIILRFLFFAPVFFISAILLFFESRKGAFYNNIFRLFGLMLQPLFLVLGYAFALIVFVAAMKFFAFYVMPYLNEVLGTFNLLVQAIMIVGVILFVIRTPGKIASKVMELSQSVVSEGLGS